MKKLIATLLILMVSPISALAGVTKSVHNTDKVALLKKAAPIEDEFVKQGDIKTLRKVCKIDGKSIYERIKKIL